MSFENRGGIPRTRRMIVTTDGRFRRTEATLKFLQVSNEGANALRLYWTEPDFDANENYIELAAATGFFEGPIESRGYWLRSVGGNTDAVSVEYARRG